MTAQAASTTEGGVLEVLTQAALRAEELRVEIAIMKDQNVSEKCIHCKPPALVGLCRCTGPKQMWASCRHVLMPRTTFQAAWSLPLM